MRCWRVTKSSSLADLLHPDVAATVRALALPAMNDDLVRTIRTIDLPPVALSDDVVRSDPFLGVLFKQEQDVAAASRKRGVG